MERVASEPLPVEGWRAVQQRLQTGGGAGAATGGVPAMGRLARLLDWAEVRYSPLAHWALNAAVAWDAGLLARLDAWRRTAGMGVPVWLDALADGEGMIALATLAHEHPDWTFPEVDDAPGGPDAPTLDARGSPTRCSPPRRAWATTCASAARAACSSSAGPTWPGRRRSCAPSARTCCSRRPAARCARRRCAGGACACARACRCTTRSRRACRSSSPSCGACARSSTTPPRRRATARAPVLYLLDEVLHGTNSQDRRAATRAVLARLAAHGAVGVVTTHDLELADEPALAPATVHRHFRERYVTGPDGPRMTFDYVARDGRAPTANALALLEALGLGPPPGGPSLGEPPVSGS
jgi:hypothetical protein